MNILPYYRRVGVFLVCFFSMGFASAGTMPANMMQTVRDATVQVRVEYNDATSVEVGLGSGVLIGPGLVLTNAHVVNEKVPIRISIANDLLPRTPARVVALRYDHNEFTSGTVVEYIANKIIENADIRDIDITPPQKNYDMAILSFVPPPGMRLPALAFARAPVRGESVIASGYPGRAARRDVDSTNAYASVSTTPQVLSSGVVTSLLDNKPRMIMHNAECSSGNSGGPVVNSRGEILGMQTWTSLPDDPSEYMALAIDSRDILPFLEANGVRPLLAGNPVPAQHVAADPSLKWPILQGADAGDPNFIALAGLLYHLGVRGFERNDELAAAYLYRAMQLAPSHPNAYLFQAGMAAVMIRSPQFGRPDLIDRLLRSANNSDRVSAGTRHPDYRLLAFESALRMQGAAAGIPADQNRSLQLAEKALEGAFAFPIALVGYHYYFGDAYAGRDHSRAMRDAREAARNGIPEGISLLAHLYYDSEVVPRTAENLHLARRLAEEAASMGDPWAYGLLANMRYDSSDSAEKAGALQLALTGLRHGNRLALYCLGRIAWDRFLSNPGDFQQAAKAWAYIELAERQGVRVALPYSAGGGYGIRSSTDMLALFPPGEQQRLLHEGRREQTALFGQQGQRATQ